MMSPLFSDEDLFRSFFYTSPVYVWIKDTQNNLIKINESAAALEGKPVAELEGRSCYDLYPKERADAFWKDDLDVIAAGKPKTAYYELHVTPGDQNKKWLKVNKMPVKTQEGKITGVMVYAIDVTDIKEAEEETRKKEEMNRLLMDIAPFPIILSSVKEDKFVYLNKAAAEVFDIPVEEALKQNPNDIYLDNQQRKEVLDILENKGNIKNREVTLKHPSGDIVYGLISAVMVDYEGTTCSYQIFHDITQLKKNEIRLSRVVEEFRLVFENSSDALFWADSDTGVIINCNRRAEELLQKKRDQIIGLRHWEIHPIEEAAKYRKLFANIERTMPGGLELEVINALGKIIPVNINVATVSLPGHRITQASIQDISARIANEKALHESESKFRLMTENMKDVIWQLTSDMRFTHLSSSFYQLSGYLPSEFVGMPFWSLLTEESSKNLRQMIEDRMVLLEQGNDPGSFSFEASQYRRDGEIIWIEVVSNSIYDAAKRCYYYQGVTRDITKRKIAEFAFKESQEKLRMVIANAPLVLFQIDSDGIFSFSDGKGLDRIGLTPGQVVGMSVYDVYNGFPDICNQVREALSGKEVREIINVNDIIFEIQYNPLFNANHQVTNIIGVALDITERKLIEDALIESEERFRSLFMEMKEGVALHELVFDDYGKPVNYKILEVNPAFTVQTGMDYRVSKNILATEHYGTAEAPYLNEYAEVALTGKSMSFETYFEPMERYFKISAVSPGKNKFATVFEDVTLQKKREKELYDKNAELERFTYTVSHDLKSPLVTIKGFIGMLEQDLANHEEENVKDDIRRIKSATDKMTHLLNDLLELSRIGRIMNPPVKVSVHSVLTETLELLAGIIKQRNVEIVTAQNLPEIYADRQRIKEVWQNLIENAVKFMGTQENPKIMIDYFQEDAKFIFSIEDNGIGIDKMYQHTVFGLFNKLDNKSEGTGIGLALVKRIVEVHGGEIWVTSEGAGRGTKISFSIPVK